MGQTKHDEFLKKMGIELPEPRSMEGFGMELPSVYMERCLDVIVPATEEYLKKVRQAVIADFMTYVQKYGEFNEMPAPVAEKEPKKLVELTEKPALNEMPKGDDLLQFVKNFLEKHPGILILDALKL